MQQALLLYKCHCPSQIFGLAQLMPIYPFDTKLSILHRKISTKELIFFDKAPIFLVIFGDHG
jgi:hypothetical protein